MTENSLSRLTTIGFVRAGQWILDRGQICADLEHHSTARNVLYAFVIDHKVMYVGKTIRELRRRMGNYRAGTKSTSTKNRRFILEALALGRAVEIYALPDNGLLNYGGFHVNLAAGLEDSIILRLDPPLNGGQKESKDEELEPLDATSVDEKYRICSSPSLTDSDRKSAPRHQLWQKIAAHLHGVQDHTVKPSFDDVEQWLGEALPASARRSPQWWSSGRAIWEEAGWKASPNFHDGVVRFRRV